MPVFKKKFAASTVITFFEHDNITNSTNCTAYSTADSVDIISCSVWNIKIAITALQSYIVG